MHACTSVQGLHPYIDKIASEGASFTRAYTASGMCSPSRYALLSGRYPSRNVYAEWDTRNNEGSGVATKVHPRPPSARVLTHMHRHTHARTHARTHKH